ncbi:VOC family protein [Paracoccus sp. S1E-3]|uniref:VOC family protein n=1 Tax=Paracoccus sp. S1E-3 TaxID=2756130 RepID=UPI0015EFD890|nr:VOC family protein [Paracoccus sp. S1E-3]MBA4490369.1 VOC family protein [Paracoccus sp. S1E-3]
MRFVNPLPFVADLDRARRFCHDVMGLVVLEDEGGFIRFQNGFAIHDGAHLHQTIFGQTPIYAAPFGRANLVLYFEDEDLDAAFARIAPHVAVIHPVSRQPWGQRVFRFHDPDDHIVEIGEPQ